MPLLYRLPPLSSFHLCPIEPKLRSFPYWGSLIQFYARASFLKISSWFLSIKNLTVLLNRHGPAEQRFGALNMTAALGRFIMRHPEVKNNMEHFMLQFVSPELSSPEPYLRAIVSLSIFVFRFLSFFCV